MPPPYDFPFDHPDDEEPPMGRGEYPRNPFTGSPAPTAITEAWYFSEERQKYLPPHKRNTGNTVIPPPRPESGMSFAEFRSQVGSPIDRDDSHDPPRRVPVAAMPRRPMFQPLPPFGAYSYVSGDYEERLAGYNAALEAQGNDAEPKSFTPDDKGKKAMDSENNASPAGGVKFDGVGARPSLGGGRGNEGGHAQGSKMKDTPSIHIPGSSDQLDQTGARLGFGSGKFDHTGARLGFAGGLAVEDDDAPGSEANNNTDPRVPRSGVNLGFEFTGARLVFGGDRGSEGGDSQGSKMNDSPNILGVGPAGKIFKYVGNGPRFGFGGGPIVEGAGRGFGYAGRSNGPQDDDIRRNSNLDYLQFADMNMHDIHYALSRSRAIDDPRMRPVRIPSVPSDIELASSATSTPYAASKAASKADLIKSGAAEDPRDIDYGNPGPSKHPNAVYNTIAPITFRRGVVSAATGKADNSVSADPVIRASNIRGNPAAYLNTRNIPAPAFLAHIDNEDFLPAFEMAFGNLPLIEACRVARPTTAGVIRILNPPYLISKAEIVAFLGRNAQIVSQPLGTPFMAVHIMMDRLSGKTGDIFVEVESTKEATAIWKSFQRRQTQGRGPRLGDRAVIVAKSSQQELMSEMFPRCKNTTWSGPVPQIDDVREKFYEGVESTGFIGFLKREEISHMIKHVVMPMRSPYSQRCTIRPYECIISTVHKYPWFDVEHVSVTERDSLFAVVMKAINALMELICKKGGAAARQDTSQPSSVTLKELVVCGLTCPGFTEMQKATIIRYLKEGNFGQYTSSKGMNLSFGGNDMFSADWPFHALVKKPGVSEGLMEYLARLLREGRMGERLSITAMLHATGNHARPFGNVNIDYAGCQTLADVGRVELRYVEESLKEILPGSHSGTTAGRGGPAAWSIHGHPPGRDLY